MGRRERQLPLVAPGEEIVLPPEVAAKAVKAMGALLLQVLGKEKGSITEGRTHDRRR
jgi:hypothetical protein